MLTTIKFFFIHIPEHVSYSIMGKSAERTIWLAVLRIPYIGITCLELLKVTNASRKNDTLKG